MDIKWKKLTKTSWQGQNDKLLFAMYRQHRHKYTGYVWYPSRDLISYPVSIYVEEFSSTTVGGAKTHIVAEATKLLTEMLNDIRKES